MLDPELKLTAMLVRVEPCDTISTVCFGCSKR